MEEWKELLGQKVYIIFDDGSRYPSKKTGKLIKVTDKFLFLKTSNKKTESINKDRIIRFEAVGGGYDE